MLVGLGDTQKQLLGVLHGDPAGVSVDVLADKLGVTATAVRQHLVALERDGLVERGATKASGGRPQQLFVLSERAREGFPRQYSWFSEILLKTLREQVGRPKLEKTLRILGEEAGAPAAAPAHATLGERAAHLVEKMGELGYDASLGEGRDIEVRARNCVFHKLAEKYPEVCEFDMGLIETIAKARAEHEECIVRGGAECRFKLKKR